jgi:class 3 adenylate cyclase
MKHFVPQLILLVILLPQNIQGQSIEELEAGLDSLYGVEKLQRLNEISRHYLGTDPKKGLKIAKQADALGENVFAQVDWESSSLDLEPLIRANYQLGLFYFQKEKYLAAKREFEQAQLISEASSMNNVFPQIQHYMIQLDSLEASGEFKDNFFSRGLGNIEIGQGLSNSVDQMEVNAKINSAERKAEAGETDEAISLYNESINMLKNLGDLERIAEVELALATLLSEDVKSDEGANYIEELIEDREALIDSINSSVDAASATSEMASTEELALTQQKLKDLAEQADAEEDFEKSLSYFKLYTALSNQIRQDSLDAAMQRQRSESEIALLKKQKEIAGLNADASRQKRLQDRNILLTVAGAFLLLSMLGFAFYWNKRREHARLGVAYQDLESTKDKLQNAEERIVNLLSQQLSPDIAQELILNAGKQPTERRFVCIMFLDIRDFTPLAENMEPEELIEYQNRVFGFMIDIIQKHHGNINQFLGDGFMATFGAPVAVGNVCQNALEASIEILEEIKRRVLAGLIPKTRVGIGLHAGKVVTGNVGTDIRKQYSITGNTVIIAARVEQLNKNYQTQLILTEEVYERLSNPKFGPEKATETEVKGRSEPIKVYLVE